MRYDRNSTSVQSRRDTSCLPDFFVIGAAKAGTTSLYNYLRQHPDIYMSPVKEPKFFALEAERLEYQGPGDMYAHRFAATTMASYLSLFDGVSKERAIGEASALYLYSSEAPRRIRHHIPDARLIAVLRDPVERAYSSYRMLVKSGRERLLSFSDALAAEPGRIEDNWEFIWHYVRAGFYGEQLSRYFELFDRSQIRIFLFRDFVGRTQEVIREIFRFLGVDESFVPNTKRVHNAASNVPRSQALARFLEEPNRMKKVLRMFVPATIRQGIAAYCRNQNRLPTRVPTEIRRELISVYRPDIKELAKLIERDLSHWLSL